MTIPSFIRTLVKVGALGCWRSGGCQAPPKPGMSGEYDRRSIHSPESVSSKSGACKNSRGQLSRRAKSATLKLRRPGQDVQALQHALCVTHLCER